MQTPSFRAPVPPVPVEAFDVPHPRVPHALDGLRILHLSDFHVRRIAHGSDRFRTLLRAVASSPADLILLTGDYTDEPGHEHAALDTLARLSAVWPTPALGAFGIFGNHDSNPFLHAARSLSRITWLSGPGREPRSATPHPLLRILGLDYPEDVISAVLSAPPAAPDALTIALVHYPTTLIPAATARIPVVFAGHTHAGQIRVSSRLAPHTSSDVPAHLASGILRLEETLCCISRGVGDGFMEGLRINCPWQVPLYTLRRAQLPPRPRSSPANAVTQIVAW